MIEVFAPGIAATTEDFKRLTVKKKARKTSSKFFAAKGYDAQLESFVKSIRAGSETAITVRDGIRATEGCLLILSSIETGEPCTFSS